MNGPEIDRSRDIAVVVITHNRVHLLQQCVERVLARTSGHTREIVIWDNASSDGTRAYLDSLGDPRLDIVHHSQNIGQNAYAEAFERTSSSYLVEVDDDVVEAPEYWDRMLLEAFERIPNIGFLAADLVDDENDQASVVRHHLRADQYRPVEIEGVELLEGPAGGGCAMTSRAVYVEAGGFPQNHGKTFFTEDAEYIARIERLGYRKAVLAALRVHHTGGPYYTQANPAKDEYWDAYRREVRRKNAVKRALLHVPGTAFVNRRLRLFGPPEWVMDDDSPGRQPE